MRTLAYKVLGRTQSEFEMVETNKKPLLQGSYVPVPAVSMKTANIPVNTKHLHNICTTLNQHQRRWADVVQMLCKCFVFTGISVHQVRTNLETGHHIGCVMPQCNLNQSIHHYTLPSHIQWHPQPIYPHIIPDSVVFFLVFREEPLTLCPPNFNTLS